MNYWLARNGRVWAGQEIGCHCRMALDIIYEKHTDVLNKYGMFPGELNPVDFLESKGYIRYMDWGTKQWVIYGQKPTRAQIRKMFDLTGYSYER